MKDANALITRLREMISAKGGNLYGGEQVTQAQHALQCAQFAEDAGATKPLIAAALLHDIGHLVEHDFESALERDEDRFHENLGDAFLRQWFGPDVTEPVRLHVASKRYLCATDPEYLSKLSAASVHSLRIQGGPMSAAEVAEFEANGNHRDAVQLRIWDDLGKDPAMKTASLDHFLDIVREVAEAA
ncbi:MAG: HD domain-containing protein [Rhizobiales bacterium]|nr:HD domain-containing protein [Hyphomicrobiales bacterium]